MIKEAQVWDALPSHGFLRSYVEYASGCTDANAAYHVAGALACLTQCAPDDYCVPYASPVFTNIYSMIVGDSSKSRKTASISIAQRIIRDAIPNAIGEIPGSQEGLYESLREANKQLIVYGEFGEFLAKAQEGYLMPMKTALTGVWDAQPIGRALAKASKGIIEKPRLSLLCGVATDLLERHTEQSDWTGGFLARFFTIHAEPEREYATPPIDDHTRRSEITNWLAMLAHSAHVTGPCLWLDDAAKAMWTEWYESYRPLREGASRRASAACSRASAIAGKIAMLLAWDIGQARSGAPWHVTVNELEPAIKLTNLHLESVLELGERVTGSRDMRDRASILRAISEVPTPLGFILREAEMLKRRANEVLESLVEERAVECIKKGTATLYVRTPKAQAMLAQMVLEAKMRGEALAEEGAAGDGSTSTRPLDNVIMLPLAPPASETTPVHIDTQPVEDIDWSSYEG